MMIAIEIYLLCGITDVKGRKYNPTLPEVFEFKDKKVDNMEYSNGWERSKFPSVRGVGESIESTTYKNAMVGVQSNNFR